MTGVGDGEGLPFPRTEQLEPQLGPQGGQSCGGRVLVRL